LTVEDKSLTVEDNPLTVEDKSLTLNLFFKKDFSSFFIEELADPSILLDNMSEGNKSIDVYEFGFIGLNVGS
jgi:hypothetical protein